MEEAGKLDLRFTPLPTGTTHPRGWLKDQLTLQANGLTGHLDEFWPQIEDSSWIGGERVPYWLDGLIPLAFQLEDADLIEKARRSGDYILKHQLPDGWFGGPGASVDMARQQRDPWPHFVLLKALVQWQEATDDERVIPAIQLSLQSIAELLKHQRIAGWAKMRWPDLAYSILWLQRRVPEASGWLADLARTAATQGYDWQSHFEHFELIDKQKQWRLEDHGVNHAMALKEAAMRAALMEEVDTHAALAQTETYIATLHQWHGQVNGLFTCDESLAGRMPSQGAETCALMEFLFSLEAAIGVLGARAIHLIERWERIAYNALPAAFWPDMCAHQYDQQVNQVAIGVFEDRVCTNNGPSANSFGSQPETECCTANMHQGFTKMTQSLWMSTEDRGLVALSYAPVEFIACVGDSAGSRVQVIVESQYPFRDTVEISIALDSAAKLEFPPNLCIPEWCSEAVIYVDDESIEEEPASSFLKLSRNWNRHNIIRCVFPQKIATEAGPSGGIAITRGPLLYSLKIEHEVSLLSDRGAPFQDYAVAARSPWAFALDPNSVRSFVEQEHRIGGQPFAPDESPVTIHGTAHRLQSWGLEHNAAGPIPSDNEIIDEADDVTLIPYGNSLLRISDFPTVSR